jgi:agmatinase
VSLSPGTGTPEPGGLRWWQTLGYLRALLQPSSGKAVLGADITETAPMGGSRVNEFTAARLICKLMAYLHQP